MTVRLFQLPAHPGRVAISKLDSFVVGGTFFLDFTSFPQCPGGPT